MQGKFNGNSKINKGGPIWLEEANAGNYHITGGQGTYHRLLNYGGGTPVPVDPSSSPVTIECTLI